MRVKPPSSADNFETEWEGRAWLDWGGTKVDIHRLREAPGFKVLSYNVYADYRCSTLRYSTSKVWMIRCRTLLDEILSYDADIVLLQDADHYLDWWQPQLMRRGYDSIWKQRTCEEFEYLDGVVIAFKRELFQLFSIREVELNRSGDLEPLVVRNRCLTDNVALVAFLQPLAVQLY